MKILTTIFITFSIALAGSASAFQDASAEDSGQQASNATFDDAVGVAQKRLEDSLQELSALRKRIAEESIPLSRELNQLQAEYEALQDEYREVDRIKDSRSLDIIRLTEEIQRREDQGVYLSNLLGKFITDWAAGLPISEKQRYNGPVDLASNAGDDDSLSRDQVYDIQGDVVQLAIDRIDDVFGGTRFEGQALNPQGEMRTGAFLVVGPAQFFRSSDGSMTGPVEQQINSGEPSVVSYTTPEQAEGAGIVINNARGSLPLDATLGNARVMEEIQETVIEHILKGGVVVWPILALGAAAILAAFLKWIGLVTIPRPGKRSLEALMTAVREHREEAALEAARAIRGPIGAMLVSGVKHIHEPKDLIDEIMFEKILVTRLRVQRFLPFIAICAAASPLLGLLGTVVGIIETFKMITLFGTGNVQTLSGGISQALITTEIGLIVAIPALLLHSFLSRQAKGVTDRMEQAAISFVNTVAVANPETSRSRRASDDDSSEAEGSGKNDARKALADLLRPILDEPKSPPAGAGG